ncbi:unnamed protein product [Rotaria magnacalcarata]|uniref:Uncharacterized protein n=1 Tax=Rotaria magnacalcarata TaxID=392030 RepID=A0A816VW02_9BILA|nr:unnamed protein product [Rotaria magnacalcarata]
MKSSSRYVFRNVSGKRPLTSTISVVRCRRIVNESPSLLGSSPAALNGYVRKTELITELDDSSVITARVFISFFNWIAGTRSGFNISANAKWAQNGVTGAGGHGRGDAINQLNSPYGLFVDDDQTVVIADSGNNRIIQWKNGDATNGQVVAGGTGKGNGLNQLSGLTDVLTDKETDSLIICDRWNRRVGLAMDERRYLYVSDYVKYEVRLYQLGEKNGTLVAGGNGKGDDLNQLNRPTYLFFDLDHSVYVSDNNNHRLMKRVKGAKEGIVVTGGQCTLS